MEIFEPLIVCGSISLILFSIGFLLFSVNRACDIYLLREENERLHSSLELLKSVKGVEL